MLLVFSPLKGASTIKPAGVVGVALLLLSALLLVACQRVPAGMVSETPASAPCISPAQKDGQRYEGRGADRSRRVDTEHPDFVPLGDSTCVRQVASGLEGVSSLTSDRKGRVVFTEYRTGRIGLVEPTAGGGFQWRYIGTYPLPEGIEGEQGLWHAAFSPTGAYLYVMGIETVVPGADYGHTSRVVRYRYRGGKLGEMEVVLSGLPAGKVHSGGALAFGPDGNLYLSIGSITPDPFGEDPLSAQATGLGRNWRYPGSLVSAIHRYTPEGQVPKDNPQAFSPVYAYGFRNPYGLAFSPKDGQLYATDNGWYPCCDRVIRVERRGDHGWPKYGDGGPGDMELMRSDPTVVQPLYYTKRGGGSSHPAFGLWRSTLRGAVPQQSVLPDVRRRLPAPDGAVRGRADRRRARDRLGY